MKKIFTALLFSVFLIAGAFFANADFELNTAEDDCKLAIIINGAVKADDDHIRYWNAVKQKWAYLEGENFTPSNIYVHYTNGTGRDDSGIVDGPASGESILETFEAIAQKIRDCESRGKRAEVLILVTDHGLSVQGTAGIPLEGGDILYPDALADLIRTLKDAGTVDVWVELGQCFSGGFIDDLENVANGVAASTGADQNHYSTRDRMRFEYYFMAALDGNYPDGNVVTGVPSTGNPWQDAWEFAKRKYQEELGSGEISEPVYGGSGIPNYCGNGVVDDGEQCDIALETNSCSEKQECSNECQCQNLCGNGQIDESEECDISDDSDQFQCYDEGYCSETLCKCIPFN